jgi:proteasome lid subunit RPN8/RPN11
MKLIIPKEIEKRIHDYVMSVDSEIAGIGRVRIEGEDIHVEEVMIVDQEVTSVTADLSPQAMAKWQTELVRAGGSPRDWLLWWHSHDTMNAFFSKRDTDTMDEHSESDWLVSLVVNKKQERKARLDTYRPFRMYMEDIDIEIEGTQAYSVPEEVAREVADKVKSKKVVLYNGGYKHTEYRDIGFSDKPAYSKPNLISQVKTLEKQLDTYAGHGDTESAEYNDTAEELIEKYRELSRMENDYAVSIQLEQKANVLETFIYGLESMEL